MFSVFAAPMFWRQKAAELHRAALLVWEGAKADHESTLQHIARLEQEPNAQLARRPSVVASFILLAGFSIENVLKARLVQIDRGCVDGKLRGDMITDHNLLRLAEGADVSLTESERVFCEVASDAMVGWGRYPVPRDQSKLKHKLLYTNDLRDGFLNLYERFSQEGRG